MLMFLKHSDVGALILWHLGCQLVHLELCVTRRNRCDDAKQGNGGKNKLLSNTDFGRPRHLVEPKGIKSVIYGFCDLHLSSRSSPRLLVLVEGVPPDLEPFFQSLKEQLAVSAKGAGQSCSLLVLRVAGGQSPG
jgi:hypothetical protein